MIYYLHILLFLGGCILGQQVLAQTPTQIVRGQVTDAASRSPIPGVNIILVDIEPLTGTTTNLDGYFIFRNVPVGRQSLRFTAIGFEPRMVTNILITSGRETVLDITMRESVIELDELEVQPEVLKERPINAMAVNSARLISMEEASRYAGGFDDPARLVSSFAGVAGSLSDNAVVIRGNAPKGVLWQMEGVGIPAPSHFANLLTLGGGGITALSSHMISDSDFYTGAFPAEYGNALSGVFDLNIRNGNNRKYQNAIRLGAIGLDAASEGPLPLSDGASYLFNYRYSTFSLITPLLPEDAGGISYQNLSYKINIPTSNSGTFSIWGIGAMDNSGQTANSNPDNWIYNQDREEVESPTGFGAAGIRHRIPLTGNTWISSTIAASGNELRYSLDRYNDDGTILYPKEYVNSSSGKLTARSVINFKVNPFHSNRTGFILSRVGYNQRIRYADNPAQPLETLNDATGSSLHYQSFTQSRFDINKITFTAGLHVQHFALTNSTSIEPRAGINYSAGRHTYSLSYGRHSQTEPVSIYFASPANRSLDLVKADHLVAGYSFMITPRLRLHSEVYYQRLFDVPVIPGTSYSLLNLELDWFIKDTFVNDGNGKNYGLDVTLERYFNDGWYGLVSGSLFDSQYQGSDGTWRNTRFNRRYTLALLGGGEWEFGGANRHRMLGFSGRLSIMGGKKISPIDHTESLERQDIVYDESQAFSLSEPPVFYADATIEYRVIRSKITSVWSLQLMNLTGYQEFYGHRLNLRKNTIEEEREMILIPNISYKIEF
ncbi:MAG: TonB-dependent receptor [Balneolales bacterium]